LNQKIEPFALFGVKLAEDRSNAFVEGLLLFVEIEELLFWLLVEDEEDDDDVALMDRLLLNETSGKRG